MKSKLFLLTAMALVLLVSCEKKDNPGSDPTPTPIPEGEKCKASDYAQATIGTQTWMAENYRCSVYDTESEAYKEGRYTIPTSESDVYTPYLVDVTDKTKWTSTKYAGNLSSEQIAKLGYLYNWAAAVGVENGEDQTTAFTGNRQGICPNGWHVPSNEDFNTLNKYVEEDQGNDLLGKYLKTTSGWYDAGAPKKYPQGLDTYGFAALPAAYFQDGEIRTVGETAYFWTTMVCTNQGAYCRYFQYTDSPLHSYNSFKNSAKSVRCVKN